MNKFLTKHDLKKYKIYKMNLSAQRTCKMSLVAIEDIDVSGGGTH